MLPGLVFYHVVFPSETPPAVLTEKLWRAVGRLVSFKIEPPLETPATRPATVALSTQVG